MTRVRGLRSKKSVKSKTPAGYLAGIPSVKRAALQRLRKTIKAAAPKAKECIAYGVPSFRLDGKFLVSYAVAAKHCAFYPGSVVQRLKPALKGFKTTKGGIQFQPDKPIPATIVRKLVKLRIAKVARTAQAK
jgi:uncharacterized protein YdhG (YjbR/CyaY superfamily)